MTFLFIYAKLYSNNLEVVILPNKISEQQWLKLKQAAKDKIKTDPISPIEKIIDKDEYVILIDEDGNEHKIQPSFIK
ncbi:hypothetical protein CL633_03645 [bacterium]|nr:hypothetical protein [bacterium]